MKLLIAIATFLTALSAQARVTNETSFCDGELKSGTYVQFEISSTAVPTFLTAIMVVGEDRDYDVFFNCKRDQKDFSAITCVEKVPSGVKFKVNMKDAAAEVYHETEVENVFNYLGTLSCR
ncbi:hypothetical protein ACES2L_02920 [Bdellovibrio bacteriovorus]